jgi:hypothetical protein
MGLRKLLLLICWTLCAARHLAHVRARSTPLAYAAVGQSGDFNREKKSDEDAETWTVACGVGWLYGLGICIGPFFGTGVGLTFPGGVLAGAGGGIGIVFGIGFGSGLLWGGGRGVVKGFGVTPPMQPPFANGLPRPADLPSFDEILQQAADRALIVPERTADSLARWLAKRRLAASS